MTPPIPPEIVVKYIGTRQKPHLWQFVQDVTVTLSDGTEKTIPKGYITNFASIPQWMQGAFPNVGQAVSIASATHDLLYDTRKLPVNWAEKKRADREFFYLLQKYNPQDEIRNKMMYVAVKLFGRKQFREEE